MEQSKRKSSRQSEAEGQRQGITGPGRLRRHLVSVRCSSLSAALFLIKPHTNSSAQVREIKSWVDPADLELMKLKDY